MKYLCTVAEVAQACVHFLHTVLSVFLILLVGRICYKRHIFVVIFLHSDKGKIRCYSLLGLKGLNRIRISNMLIKLDSTRMARA